MKKNNRDLLQLPFDKYQRYKIIEEIINSLRDKKRMKILDVGGNPGLLEKFLPNDNVVVLDIEKGSARRFVSGDALRLPFPNRNFDIVVSADVFEHIPFKNKKRFLEEELRVSKRFNIIGGPYRDREVTLAEKILSDFIYAKYNIKYKILEEHSKNKLPDLDSTLSFVKNKGLDCVWINNGYLYNWLFMILLNFHFEWMDSTKTILNRINEFYNRNFYASDNKAPSYRKIIVTSKDKKANLKRIVERYKCPEENRDEKLHKIGLANLLMKVIETENLREKEEEIKKLRGDFREKVKVLKEWNTLDKKRLEKELDKVAKISKKEVARLNKEIETLHRTYAQKLRDSETHKDKEKTLFIHESTRLNEEIKKLHASYTAQIQRLTLEKEKTIQNLSKETDRLNKEIETLHKTYTQKLKDSETHKDKEKTLFIHESTRLNEEIKELHASYKRQMHRSIQEEESKVQALSKETNRLNKEIEILHTSYSQKFKGLEVDKKEAEKNLSQEIARLNNEIQNLHQIYSKQIDKLNKEIKDLHSAYSQKINDIIRQKDEELRNTKGEISSLKQTHLDNMKDFMLSKTDEIKEEILKTNRKIEGHYKDEIDRLKLENNSLKDRLDKIYSSPFYKLYKNLKLDKIKSNYKR